MKFTAHITIFPLDNLLDPAGKAVSHSLDKIGIQSVEDVRIGKSIRIQLEADTEDLAKQIITTACEKLLYNKVMEQYSFTLDSVS